MKGMLFSQREPRLARERESTNGHETENKFRRGCAAGFPARCATRKSEGCCRNDKAITN